MLAVAAAPCMAYPRLVRAAQAVAEMAHLTIQRLVLVLPTQAAAVVVAEQVNQRLTLLAVTAAPAS